MTTILQGIDWATIIATAITNGIFLWMIQLVISKAIETKEKKRIEEFKTELSLKEHVTKNQFDNEFETVLQLTQSWYSLTYLSWQVIGNISGPASYEKMKSSCDSFNAEYRHFLDIVYGRGITLHEVLYDYFLKCAAIINKFNTLSYHIISEQEKFDDALRSMPDSAFLDDYYDTHIGDNIRLLEEIHDEINTGEEYGIKAMTEKCMVFFKSQQIIP